MRERGSELLPSLLPSTMGGASISDHAFVIAGSIGCYNLSFGSISDWIVDSQYLFYLLLLEGVKIDTLKRAKGLLAPQMTRNQANARDVLWPQDLLHSAVVKSAHVSLPSVLDHISCWQV